MNSRRRASRTARARCGCRRRTAARLRCRARRSPAGRPTSPARARPAKLDQRPAGKAARSSRRSAPAAPRRWRASSVDRSASMSSVRHAGEVSSRHTRSGHPAWRDARAVRRDRRRSSACPRACDCPSARAALGEEARMQGQPDLIVVGGGSAGLACAARLAEGGLRVLLVEAGKGHHDPRLAIPALMSALVHKPAFDWCYTRRARSLGRRPARRLAGGQAARRRLVDQRDDVHPRPPVGLRPLGRARRDRLGLRQRAALLPPAGGQRARRRRMARAGRPDRGLRSALALRGHRRVDRGGRAGGHPALARPQRRGRRGRRPHPALAAQRACAARPPPATCATSPPTLEILLEAQVLEDRGRGRPRDRRHHPPRRRGAHADRAPRRRAQRRRAQHAAAADALGHRPGRRTCRSTASRWSRDLPGVGQNLQEHPGCHLVNAVSAHTLNDDARGFAGLPPAARAGLRPQRRADHRHRPRAGVRAAAARACPRPTSSSPSAPSPSRSPPRATSRWRRTARSARSSR